MIREVIRPAHVNSVCKLFGLHSRLAASLQQSVFVHDEGSRRSQKDGKHECHSAISFDVHVRCVERGSW